MEAKEKAVELAKRFKDIVYPYMGSGMLSNTCDDGIILFHSKICAKIVVEEIANVGNWVAKEFQIKEGFEVESTEEFSAEEPNATILEKRLKEFSE